MFMGEYSHSIDAKGRLIIPAKIREQLGERCIITQGLDQCLSVYDESKWETITTALNQKSSSHANIRMLKRFMLGKATEVEFDKQGRVLIPASLRAAADLDKETVIVGVGSHVEIWSADRWNTYIDEMAPNMEALVESIEDLAF
ncbi:MAG: division/cell wall cluster transcriptional repressor MraZ [Veillonella sp.]|nr:division/cell wall cluster transcriptional repressor MraZ [Veillonella sp.]MCF0155899.1 division/cell wall cluster transcriptional repressor MraZ [Veillonella sp.]